MNGVEIKCSCCDFTSVDDSDFVITADIHKQLKHTHEIVCTDCANEIKNVLDWCKKYVRK